MWRLWAVSLGAWLLLAAAPRAQQNLTPEPIATRQNLFSIPFRIEPARSAAAEPVEAQLFVSTDRGQSWQLAARAEPRLGRFQFHAPRDGEYWFAIRTLDRGQRLRPERALSPELMVLVDTVAPMVEVAAARGPAGEVQIRWKMADPHLDPASLRLDFRRQDEADWHPVAIDPQRSLTAHSTGSGETTIWPSDVEQPLVVRVRATDRSGNPAVAQSLAPPQSAPEAASAGGVGPLLTSQTSGPPRGDQAAPAPRPASRPWAGPLPAPTARQRDARNWPADRVLSVPLGRQSVERIAAPQRDAAGTAQLAEDLPLPRTVGGAPHTPATTASQRELLGPAVEELAGGAPVGEPLSRGPEPVAGILEAPEGVPASPAAFPLLGGDPGGAQTQMVNSRRFELEYDIESAGPAGVSRVELWETRDRGRSWQPRGVDPDNRSPMLVEVEGEGVYGFAFVISSDTGLSGRPPVAGDPPEVLVAVDLSAPVVKLASAELGAGKEAGELRVFWTAEDQSLAPRPISLLFGETPEGPWQVISAGLENHGQFVWRIDNRAPDAIFLRVEARDAAGNVGSDQSPEPLHLATVRPSARIRYVRPVPGSASRPRVYQFFR